MTVLRSVLATVMAAGVLAASPASAQFFMKSHDFSGEPVRGDEPGIGLDLPDATEAELTAGLVWNLRAALNIAALQCQFAPTLLTVPQYNGMMIDHAGELKSTYATLAKYFARKNKAPKAAQNALDQFGTRIYGSFSTTAAQYGFCQVASNIGRDAIFIPRGSLHTLAKQRMREFRNALVPWGEQRFPRGIGFDRTILVPRMDPICWKKDQWNTKTCGPTVQWVVR
ncbi:hypothetical protein [Sphingomonas sp. GB1N7]|uniref:hypothetical protein n=1 Tax=Parasphingomonas caseinilytica TaxID=3096158 RepID=UPI002FC9AFF7